MTPAITLTTSASHGKLEKLAPVPIIPVGAQPPSQTTRQKLHKFGLARITKPVERATAFRMMLQAAERIMAAESKAIAFFWCLENRGVFGSSSERVVNGGATTAHAKILVHMASTFNVPELQQGNPFGFLRSQSYQKKNGNFQLWWPSFWPMRKIDPISPYCGCTKSIAQSTTSIERWLKNRKIERKSTINAW